ncbi:MAG TPA: hypothetical protein VFN50_06535 [Acidimicrobiales bacterium]|nr:hypothetical protein [Acidimicrobiales bacterium]
MSDDAPLAKIITFPIRTRRDAGAVRRALRAIRSAFVRPSRREPAAPAVRSYGISVLPVMTDQTAGEL